MEVCPQGHFYLVNCLANYTDKNYLVIFAVNSFDLVYGKVDDGVRIEIVYGKVYDGSGSGRDMFFKTFLPNLVPNPSPIGKQVFRKKMIR